MDDILVGTRKGLFTLRGGEIARVSFLGAPVTAVLSRDGSLFAAVGHGHFGAKLHRSQDRGETWKEVASPQWPPKPADADDRNPFSGAAWPWTLDQIWTLEADSRGPDALWCGTIPGGLFHSTDAGASWRLVRSLWDRPERKQWGGGGYDFAGIHSICVDPRDPRRVLAGVSTGGAWRTEDGGESWTVASQGMRPRDPDTAWFVPAVKDEQRVPVEGAMAVTRTRDGGKTFQALRSGLPQRHAYHLVYRHCLEVAPDGETLAMGSTTGALWTSRDAGESWAALSRDLPPVFCVRFAS